MHEERKSAVRSADTNFQTIVWQEEEAARRVGTPGLTSRVCTPDGVNVEDSKEQRSKCTAVQVSTPRQRPHLAHISSLIKNQLIPEDTSETQLKTQKTQMMSQHHAPWLKCGGGVRMVNHRQQVGPQDGNLGTGPPSFSDCTRAPAHCLLLLLSHISCVQLCATPLSAAC